MSWTRKRAGLVLSTATVSVVKGSQLSWAMSASFVVAVAGLVLSSAAPCDQWRMWSAGVGRRSVRRAIRRLISPRLKWMSGEGPFLLYPYPAGGRAGWSGRRGRSRPRSCGGASRGSGGPGSRPVCTPASRSGSRGSVRMRRPMQGRVGQPVLPVDRLRQPRRHRRQRPHRAGEGDEVQHAAHERGDLPQCPGHRGDRSAAARRAGRYTRRIWRTSRRT